MTDDNKAEVLEHLDLEALQDLIQAVDSENMEKGSSFDDAECMNVLGDKADCE